MNKGTKDKASPEISDVIAKILIDLRELHGYTQKYVADTLCVTVSAISHYEKGISVPPTEAIIALANLYNVSTDYILGRCTSKADYTKIVDTKLSDKMTIGKGIEIMRNMSRQEKEHFAFFLDMFQKSKK